MPRKKGSSNKNGKPLIDLNNLDQAKNLLEQIFNILSKGIATTANKLDISETLEDNEKLFQLWNKLGDLVDYKIKGLSTGAVDFRDNLEGASDEVRKQIEAYEKRLELEAKEAVYKEQQLQQARQEKALEDNKLKLQRDKNSMLEYANRLQDKQLKKIKDQAAEEYKNLKGKEKRKYKNEADYVQQRTDSFKNLLNTNVNNRVNKLYERAEQEGRSITRTDLKEILEDAIEDINNPLNDNAYTRQTKNIKESAEKFNLSSLMFDSAVNAFKEGIGILTTLFKNGIKQQSDIYDKTFQNIATRTGASAESYRVNQRAVYDDLQSKGLSDNIKVTDVQEMWNTLADMGIKAEVDANSDQISLWEKGIENVITKNIVPYLDVNSADFNLLNSRLDGNFVKQIRGINAASLDIANNNAMTEDLLKELIDQVQPMSDEALKNLAQGSTELAAYANLLVDRGMSRSQANEIITQLYKEQQYSDQIMSSGTAFEKTALLRNIRTGTNVYDPLQYNNAVGNITNVGQELASIGPGYGSTMSGLIQNTANTAIFGSGSFNLMNGLDKLTKAGTSGSELADLSDLTEEEFKKEIEKEEERLKNGETQPERYRQETTIENMATDLATLREKFGNFYDIAATFVDGILKGIEIFFGAKFLDLITGGKIGTWLSGSSTASSALASTAGGILAVGGGIAIGAAAAAAISHAIDSAKQKATDENVDQYTQEMLDLGASQEFAEATGKIGGAARAGSENNSGVSGFFHDWGQGISQTTNTLGYEIKGIFGGMTATDKTKHSLNTLLTSMDMGNYSQGTQEKLLWTFAMLADSAGVLDKDISKQLGGVTRTDIKNYMKENHLSEETFNKSIEVLKGITDIDGVTTLPWKDNKTQQIEINWDNYHRQGLNEVPYDDYPAILHEGEAVLTAGTADQLRNVVEEYRETKDLSADFEVIIQSQTASLINKLDELIQAVNNIPSTGFSSTTNNTSTTNLFSQQANSVLKNSMMHIRNTRSFVQ